MSAARVASADRAWASLASLDLAQLGELEGARGAQSERFGIIGGRFSRWRERAQAEGFSVREGAPLPTLTRDGISVMLRVRDGVVLGARVAFSGEVGGPDWAQVVSLLAGQGALGGPDDPMMTLDQLQNIDPEQVKRGDASPSAISGAWGVGERRTAYLLELAEGGSPRAARLWVDPQPTAQ